MIKIVRRENISVWINGLGEARECVCTCVCVGVFLRLCVLCLFPGVNTHKKHRLLLCLLWRQVTPFSACNYAVTSFIVVFIIWICRNKFNILKAKTLFILNQMKTNCNGPCRFIYDYYTPKIHNIRGREGGGAEEQQSATERCLSSSLYKLQKCIYRVMLAIKVSYSESQYFVYLKSNRTPEPRKTSFLHKSTFILKWAVANSDWFW